jgi:hypothetical protein
MPRIPSPGMRTLGTRLCLACATGAALLIASAASGQPSDPLAAGFENPPLSAKPRVWWHWIDGNVSEHGIREDLAWLNQVGIGGVHNFDAALTGPGSEPPRLVEKRIAYLTPDWRQMFRFAVDQAHQLGMEFTIASSPGWSESGGPWVKPEQAMKKLVWSETFLTGGKPFTGSLRDPPHETGPFQDVPFASVPFATNTALPQYYADAAVMAYRLAPSESTDVDLKPQVTSSAGPIDAGRLSDGDLAHPVLLPFGEGKTSWIQFAYAKPQRIQSITVAVARPAGLAPSDVASGGDIWLEAGDDGPGNGSSGQSFHRVVDVPRSGAPQQTLEFKPVTARFFRLVLERPDLRPSGLEALLGRPAGPPPTAHRVFEVALHAEPRVNRFEDKAGFSNRAITASDDTPPVDVREAIPKDSVVDLTSRMRPDGTLDWTPPRGRWVVLRFGYSLTGRTNHPASREGTGLEVDKLNQDDVKAYFNAYFGEYQKTLDPQMIGKQGLQFMLTDSYEAGIANWTKDILQQFSRRRGYDPRPYLPVLAGRVVGSSAASDRFLWDFRQTLADLIADNHYGELSTLLHEHGLGRYGESHESGRAFVGDGMQVKKSADVPMGALWSSTLGQPRATFDADIRESASVAHIYGRNLVAAESLTAFGNTFAFYPETLKPYADRELADGLNRFVIHTSVHQPDDRLGPGVTLGPFGQWFTRHETWAQQARPWVSYLARSAYLLQQGRFVADIAYLYGEDNNITNLFGRNPPPIPPGYNFDYVNADALVNVLTVKDGRLATPSGMQYRVLALDPSTQRMSAAVLRKISALVEQGAIVVGARPTMTPSLADDEGEFNSIAARLWGEHPSVGKGKVLAETLAAALPQLSIEPDCTFKGAAGEQLPWFVHRHLEQGDLYFVSNRTDAVQMVRASFRVAGKAPQIWRADTGEIAPASYNTEGGRTEVPLKLQPYDALFVVFRQDASEPSRLIKEPVSEVVASVSGPWEVSFPPDHGAPPHAHFAELSSWTASSDPGVKYFSGTATYTTTFTGNNRWVGKGARVQLNLGDVKDIAEVTLNGRQLGVLWKHPFVVDVTGALHAGRNQLEVKVTNVWPNRLIGDKQPGARQIAYTTFDPYKADSPLLPSGLLGPVTLSRVSLP